MIDGIANTGTHTFVEKNKIFPMDIHLYVHSHLWVIFILMGYYWLDGSKMSK
jgi:hypothetical protein